MIDWFITSGVALVREGSGPAAVGRTALCLADSTFRVRLTCRVYLGGLEVQFLVGQFLADWEGQLGILVLAA